MNPPERSPSIPPDARWEANWDSYEYLWITGEVVNGIRQGAYRYYRIDGTLCSEDVYADGVLNGPAKRFHENGEVSQQGQMRDGLRHGLWQWIRSTGATTELTLPATCHKSVWMGEKMFDHGKAGPSKYYDTNMVPVSEDGTPVPDRPPGVPPEAAYYKHENTWFFGFTADEVSQHHRVGEWNWWNAKGILLKQTVYTEKGYELEDKRFYDNGQLSYHRKRDNFLNEISKALYEYDGTLRKEIRRSYENDSFKGVEKYGSGGVLLWRGTVRDNDMETYTFYYEDGGVRAEGQETRGVISGIWLFYDKDGQVIHEVDVKLLGFTHLGVDDDFELDHILGHALMPTLSDELPEEMKGADKIKWGTVGAAYTPRNQDFPRFIRGLISPEPSVRFAALRQITWAAEEDGRIYKITTLVIPFILAALAHKNADKLQLLKFLNLITPASLIQMDPSQQQETGSKKTYRVMKRASEVRNLINKGSSKLEPLIGDTNPDIRIQSLLLLRLAPATNKLLEKLRKAADDDDSYVQATAVYVLLSLEHDVPEYSHVFFDHPNKLVQLVAAIFIAIRHGPQAPAQTVAVLKQIFNENDAELRVRFHSLPFVRDSQKACICYALGLIGNRSALSLLPALCNDIDDVDSISITTYAQGLLILAARDESATRKNNFLIVLKALAVSRRFFYYVNSADVLREWRLPVKQEKLRELIVKLEKKMKSGEDFTF